MYKTIFDEFKHRCKWIIRYDEDKIFYVFPTHAAVSIVLSRNPSSHWYEYEYVVVTFPYVLKQMVKEKNEMRHINNELK